MTITRLHIVATVCAVLGCLLVIAALVTPGWMIGCIPVSNVVMVAQDFPDGSEIANALHSFTLGAEDEQLCFNEGLLYLSIKSEKFYNTTAGITVAAWISLMIATAALVAAVLSSVGAVVSLVLASRIESNSYEGKARVTSRTRLAMGLVVIAGIATVIGMSSYTGGMHEVTHSPYLFTVHLAQTFQSTLERMLGPNDLDMAFPSDMIRGMGDKDISLGGLLPSTREFLKKFVAGMDPTFGYSFILGWTAAPVFIVAGVVAITATQRLIAKTYQPESITNISL